MAVSVHFEFLNSRRPVLAELAGLAEKYALPDPPTALLKLRTFAERLVDVIYETHELPEPLDGGNLNDRLNDPTFQKIAPRVVLDKLHFLRRRGNRAAHANEGTTESALAALSEAFDLARWLHGFVDGGAVTELGAFDREKLTTETSKSQLQREKKALLIQLERQEAMLADVLAKLDAEREQRKTVEATVVELETYRQRADATSNKLGFKEEVTRRRLIDAMLVDAGWQVGVDGKSTDEVKQEVKLSLVPDEKGNGFADYVLFGDDGKPLAVVEAKRTAKDSEAGRTQAWLYSQALEREHGQRPVMFYTNGIDVMIRDDRSPSTQARKLYGFYGKKSLEFVFFQRAHRDDKLQVVANPVICERLYQAQAIKAVTERFATGHRKALLVLATGTGKTRIAVSLCDLLMRANWAKRILFLCDRKELRKQAGDAFAEFLPDAPRVIVSRATATDRDQRIYLATYPAMAKCYTAFDVGFFDLIIADESHRSIYNRYRDLLRWFDAMQIGLTATPRSVMSHQTYRLFGCETLDPTYGYDYHEAISAMPAYLVPFRVVAHTTQFLRDGMRWADMTEDQRRGWEEQEPDAVDGGADVDVGDMDRQVLNTDTARKILRNLMEHGLRDASGSRPGKTIVFARGHRHAVLLAATFSELYPQYGGDFCQVIDSHDDRAEQLLSHFKDAVNNLTIAVSVDMLDTGIDVPQVVNLVFAKPVRSYVKFWQMIGRGTRLCPGLFGPGLDKKEFLIFDHWGNFDWFGEKRDEVDEPLPRSLMQRVFEARIAVAAVALDKFDDDAFRAMIPLLLADLQTLLKTRSIRVRDHWREVHALCDMERLRHFDAATVAEMQTTAAPLMAEVDLRGDEPARRFDLLLAETQLAVLQQNDRLAALQARVTADVERLPKNLAPVKAQGAIIQDVRGATFWALPTVTALDKVRTDLRGVMQYKPILPPAPGNQMRILDVADGGEHREERVPKLEGQELVAYRQRVKNVLDQRLATDPVIAKIRVGQPVTEAELVALALQVQHVDPLIDLLLLRRTPAVTTRRTQDGTLAFRSDRAP